MQPNVSLPPGPFRILLGQGLHRRVSARKSDTKPTSGPGCSDSLGKCFESQPAYPQTAILSIFPVKMENPEKTKHWSKAGGASTSSQGPCAGDNPRQTIRRRGVVRVRVLARATLV
jgi:hypothetical protein